MESQRQTHKRLWAGLFAWWHATPLYWRILGAVALGAIVGIVFGPRAGGLEMPSKLVLRVLGALAPH